MENSPQHSQTQEMYLTQKSSYFYDLPEELIAQFPLEHREESRLLYLDKKSGEIAHLKFGSIIDLLREGDVLVINNTKVIPARLFGQKATGGLVEVFLLHQEEGNKWQCLVRPGNRIREGQQIFFGETLRAIVVDHLSNGNRVLDFEYQGDFWDVLNNIGKVPLPPYIHRDTTVSDTNDYQTVYARERGSVAAPTAGLHFTSSLLTDLQAKGIILAEVLLHVGLGTFRPVKVDNIEEHEMHSEYCSVSPQTAQIVNKAKSENRRIIAVGTTSTRTLESFSIEGELQSGEHWTNIFLYPGKKFEIVDGLITNFHMPESTLIMLVAAFAGYENVMRAYKEAVDSKYRFFSYGDAMVII